MLKKCLAALMTLLLCFAAVAIPQFLGEGLLFETGEYYIFYSLRAGFANYIGLHKPALRVLYTTCEKFINELIDSIYLNKGNNRDMQAKFRIPLFRRLRSVSVGKRARSSKKTVANF